MMRVSSACRCHSSFIFSAVTLARYWSKSISKSRNERRVFSLSTTSCTVHFLLLLLTTDHRRTQKKGLRVPDPLVSRVALKGNSRRTTTAAPKLVGHNYMSLQLTQSRTSHEASGPRARERRLPPPSCRPPPPSVAPAPNRRHHCRRSSCSPPHRL